MAGARPFRRFPERAAGPPFRLQQARTALSFNLPPRRRVGPCQLRRRTPACRSCEATPPVPLLDPNAIAALRELNPGDDSFFRDLVQIYLDDSPARIAELEDAVAHGDAHRLTLAAHSLKGSSANFGASTLRTMCERVEMLGRQSSLGDVPALLPPLKDEFTRVKAELESLLPAK